MDKPRRLNTEELVWAVAAESMAPRSAAAQYAQVAATNRMTSATAGLSPLFDSAFIESGAS